MPKFIDELRALTEKEKKIVIFTIVIGVGLVLGFFWVKSAAQNISKLQSVNLPKIEIPDLETSSPALETQDPMADWKTYTNTEYGFEFKYPDDWRVGEETAKEDYFIVYIGKHDPVQVYGIFALAIRYENKEEYLASLERFGYFKIGESDVLLGGQKASLYTFGRNDSDLQWRMIIAEKNGNTIEFSMDATKEYDNIFNDMLSTFKFTK